MEKKGIFSAFLRSLLLLVILGFVFSLLAPTRIGGRTSYVIVTGNSMEPFLHRGDLTILRQTGDYEIGDVVTYHHPRLGRVIHRIVDRSGDKYILQGDNNSWIDSYQPVVADIAGELLLHIPRAGSVVWGFRTPLGAALLAGVIGVLLFWPGADEQEAEAEPG